MQVFKKTVDRVPVILIGSVSTAFVILFKTGKERCNLTCHLPGIHLIGHMFSLRSTIAVLGVLVSFTSGCSLFSGTVWPRSRIEITINGVPARVEVVRTRVEREKGLMHRTSLGKDEGMLFVFPEEKIQSFWMKNTLIPLDVAFFDSQGFLVDIQRMEPDDGERIYTSAVPALYALEMNAGWFAEKDLRRFARLQLPYPITGE
jgi:uncharacterized membrane protein (UPF0127 family)